MALNDQMTALADAFRKRYGTSDKLGISDMITLLGKTTTPTQPQPPAEQVNVNLLQNTDDYAGVGSVWKTFQWSGLSGTFQGLTVANLNSGGIITQRTNIVPGSYVFSCFVRISDGRSSGTVNFSFNDGDTNDKTGVYVTSDWKRYYWDSFFYSTGRFEVSPEDTKIQIAGQKLESGDTLTAYITKAGQKVTAPLVKVDEG